MQRFAVEQGSLAPALALEVLAAAHRHPAMPAAWQPHALAFDRRREAFATAFAASLEHGVAAATRSPDAAEPAPAQRRVLALQDEAEVDTGIALSGTADLIAAEAEAELRELQTYTSALAGCTHVNPRSNPFRPLAYAQALWDAIGAVCGNVPERGLLLKALSPGLARSLRPHWMSACTRLDNQGVTPSLYRTVVLAGPVQPAEPVAEPIAGPAPAQVPSLPPAPPAVARPSAAFEAALSDASLPAEFRLMLARLFGATARLSVADARVLDDDHAVWPLLKRLVTVARMESRGVAAPDGDTVEFCERLIDGLADQRAHEPMLFQRALVHLEAFIVARLKGEASPGPQAPRTGCALERAA